LPPGEATDTPAVPPSSDEGSAIPNEIGEAADKSEKEEFDLASLPPIDSIVEGTDISVFLKQGVPLDLTRAALRRAWSTDPAIRDFIGLAENAWDFNDPNAMPGFGPLDQSPEEVRQMLAQVMGEVRESVETAISSEVVPVESAKDPRAIAGIDDPVVPLSATDSEADPQFDPSDQPAPPRIDMAAQHSEGDSEQPILRRTHGGALPR
jgi:hypothetical protein